MGWPIIGTSGQTSGSQAAASSSANLSGGNVSTFNSVSATLFSLRNQSRTPSQPTAQPLPETNSHLAPTAIIESALTKAAKLFNAAKETTQREFNSYRETLVKFLSVHIEKIKELAANNEALSNLVLLHEEFLNYQELTNILHQLDRHSKEYAVIAACRDLFCGALYSANVGIENAILTQIDIADECYKQFRDHSDEAILSLSKLITAIQRTHPEAKDIHRLEGLFRQVFQQIFHHTFSENAIHFSEAINKILPPPIEIASEVNSAAIMLDEHINQCHQAARMRHDAFIATQQEITKCMFFTIYLARKHPRIAAFITYTKMDSFWEQAVPKALRDTTVANIPFQTQKGLIPWKFIEATQCDTFMNVFKNSSEAFLEKPIIKKMITLISARANQVECFPRLRAKHIAIRDQIALLDSPESQSILTRAIELAIADPKLTDTSSIFPQTLEAQLLFRTPAILQEAKNKFCIADNLVFFSMQERDESKQKTAFMFAQIFAQRALHDIYLAKILETDSEAATHNALRGKSLLEFTGGTSQFTDWVKLEHAFTSYVQTNHQIHLTSALLSELKNDAKKTAIDQFQSTAEKANEALSIFAPNPVPPLWEPKFRVFI